MMLGLPDENIDIPDRKLVRLAPSLPTHKYQVDLLPLLFTLPNAVVLAALIRQPLPLPISSSSSPPQTIGHRLNYRSSCTVIVRVK
jgi:hypothetical protein